MTKIIVSDDDNNTNAFETLTSYNLVNRLIQNLLNKYDAQFFLSSLSLELKEYLNKAFSISIKELHNFFNTKFETISFVDNMVKFGYLIKYHTTHKVTTKYFQDIDVSTILLSNKFSLNENVLFNETLGLDLIKYMLNSKNFQKFTFMEMCQLKKKQADDTLDYLIYQGYLTKLGTTYCITEKFKKKAAEYQELFQEKEDD